MKLQLHSLALVLSLFFLVPAGQDVRTLEPGKSVEREIAGGQSHTFQIALAAGQFLHFLLDQQSIDEALVLEAPNGKQLVDVDLSVAGWLEPLAAEAAASGDYRLTVRAKGSAAIAGFYRVRLEVKAMAAAQDRQRLSAERLLAEARKSLLKRAAEPALENAQPALALCRELGDRYWEGFALFLIGTAHSVAQKHEQALDSYSQALAIIRELKDRAGEANTLKNMGNANISLGRNEQAMECLEQALVFYREVKNRSMESNALINLGFAYGNVSRNEKAVESLGQALAFHREMKNRADEAYVLSELGRAYSRLGRYETAIEYYERALTIAREVKNRVNELEALNNLGNTYSRLGRPEKGIESYEQALVISREIHARDYEADTLYGLASVESAQGKLPAARAHVEQSLTIVESLRSNEISSLELRASFLTSFQNSYQLYTDVLMRQHQAEPSKGFDALAVEVSERQRARSLLDLLAVANINLREGVDPTLIERERAVAKQLNDKARTQTSTPVQAAALKQEISQLENDYERAQVAIRKANPRYAALTQPQPLKLTQIQAQLDTDTLLLEYALGEERSYLWVISKDSLKSYELPKEAQIR